MSNHVQKKENATNILDNRLFLIVSFLLFVVAIILAGNLCLQWNNYNQAIKAALLEGEIHHELVLNYSRAMDFAFVKTSTIFLGFIIVLVGVLFVLRVEEVSYEIGITKDNFTANLQTASPGLVLVTLGVITILFTTYNKTLISYSSSAENPISNVEYFDINSVVDNLSFQNGSDNLTKQSLVQIDKICSYIESNRTKTVLINSPSNGDMMLSQRRNNYLKNLLKNKCSNTSAFQINTISYGEEPPLRQDDAEQERKIITFK